MELSDLRHERTYQLTTDTDKDGALLDATAVYLKQQAQMLSEANAVAKRRALIDADRLSRNDHLRIQAGQ